MHLSYRDNSSFISLYSFPIVINITAIRKPFYIVEADIHIEVLYGMFGHLKFCVFSVAVRKNGFVGWYIFVCNVQKGELKIPCLEHVLNNLEED